jgi:hypothetical protein
VTSKLIANVFENTRMEKMFAEQFLEISTMFLWEYYIARKAI